MAFLTHQRLRVHDQKRVHLKTPPSDGLQQTTIDQDSCCRSRIIDIPHDRHGVQIEGRRLGNKQAEVGESSLDVGIEQITQVCAGRNLSKLLEHKCCSAEAD